VRYGLERGALVNDHWTYRGVNLYAAYDTRQVFKENYSDGLYSMLSPWHTHGRYANLPEPLVLRLKRFLGLLPRPLSPVLPQRPLVALVARLPVEQRIKHFRALELAGAL
jgi:hypothetical protein